MGRLAGPLVRGDGVPQALADHGVAAADLAPERLAAFAT
jgi:hypothetical protein